ncbi:MAG: formate hydrogenlyase subunit 3/multisubunit Na+/H+ antiporter MnhD subunit [Rickettsiales bacterium]
MSIFFATLFIIGGFGIQNIDQSLTINLLNLPNGFSFDLALHSSSFLLIEILGFFWLMLAVYSSRYFLISEDLHRTAFCRKILIIVGFLSAIILSKNLITALLFYQLLALTLFLVAKNHSPQKSITSAQNFGFFALATSSMMFLSVALIFKISGQNDFILGGFFDKSQMSIGHFSLLLFFFAISIFSIAFLPVHLLFNRIYSLKPPTLILILVSFGFAVLILFFKIITSVFGIKFFADLFGQINHYNWITIVLGLNLFTSIVLALLSSNLKKILTLLFYNQLILAIMAFLTFGLGYKQMQIVMLSFVFGQILIFICVGNINLYLRNSGAKSLSGVVRKLPITSLAFVFALFGFAGLVPAIGFVEKYYLFKNIWQDEAWISAAILIINVLFCLLCAAKIIYPMMGRLKKSDDYDFQIIAKNEARRIEWNFSFIMPILAIMLMMFIFSFPQIVNLFIK